MRKNHFDQEDSLVGGGVVLAPKGLHAFRLNLARLRLADFGVLATVSSRGASLVLELDEVAARALMHVLSRLPTACAKDERFCVVCGRAMVSDRDGDESLCRRCVRAADHEDDVDNDEDDVDNDEEGEG